MALPGRSSASPASRFKIGVAAGIFLLALILVNFEKVMYSDIQEEISQHDQRSDSMGGIPSESDVLRAMQPPPGNVEVPPPPAPVQVPSVPSVPAPAVPVPDVSSGSGEVTVSLGGGVEVEIVFCFVGLGWVLSRS